MSAENTIPQNQIERLPVIFNLSKYQEDGICPIFKRNICPNKILCNECNYSQNTFQKVSDALTTTAEKQGYHIRVLQRPLLAEKSRGFTYEFSKRGLKKIVSITQSGGALYGYWLARSVTETF
jgi:predicted nucleic acid-binding Zn ribbon protein